MPVDRLASDIRKLEQTVERLSALEMPLASAGLWADRPPAPVDKQQYFATDSDRKIEYFWDSTTNQWLSTQEFEEKLIPSGTTVQPQTYTVNTGGSHYGAVSNFKASSSYYLTRVAINCSTAATYSNTAKWQANLEVYNSANSVTSQHVAVLYDAIAGKTAANTIYNFSADINAVFTTTNGIYFRTTLYANLFGATAGTLSIYKNSVFYRLVG